MRLKTKYFGEIDCPEEDKLFFPDGLFGFEEEKEFFLLDVQLTGIPGNFRTGLGQKIDAHIGFNILHHCLAGEFGREKNGLHIKSRPIKVNIDTFEARNSLSPTLARYLDQNARAYPSFNSYSQSATV